MFAAAATKTVPLMELVARGIRLTGMAVKAGLLREVTTARRFVVVRSEHLLPEQLCDHLRHARVMPGHLDTGPACYLLVERDGYVLPNHDTRMVRHEYRVNSRLAFNGLGTP